MTVHLFPITEYWWLYLAFLAFILVLLLLDLGVFHRRPHTVALKEAAMWSVVWVSLALLFNVGLYYACLWWFPQDARLMGVPGFNPEFAAKQVALEFLTGFVIEKSLSVDNIFVFVLVFSYFAVPSIYQHRVLFFGILGALVFRGIFISIGAALMQFHWVIYVFGAFLLLTGLKILFGPEKEPEPEKNLVLRLARRFIPVTPELHGQHFFIRDNGILKATPLFMALLFLEVSDVIFAVDSVPAIFAVSREPFVVFTSNIFAILGLRAMYFLLAGVVDVFYLLKYGLGIILIFVGLKMVWLNDLFDGKFPISWSLGFIGLVLASSIGLSLIFKKKPETEPSRESKTP